MQKTLAPKSFELSSALLFAALTLSWGTVSWAQQAPRQQRFAPQAAGAAAGPAFGPATGAGPAPLRPTAGAQAAMAAFDRADTNQDGRLSAQEAARLPAIAQRFHELDADRDGSLSRAEFERGANS